MNNKENNLVTHAYTFLEFVKIVERVGNNESSSIQFLIDTKNKQMLVSQIYKCKYCGEYSFEGIDDIIRHCNNCCNLCKTGKSEKCKKCHPNWKIPQINNIPKNYWKIPIWSIKERTITEKGMTLKTKEINDNPTEIYNKIISILKQSLVLQRDIEYKILTLLIMSTYFLDAFESIPFPLFTGKTHSGKTTALDLIKEISYRGVVVDTKTEADINDIASYNVTLLIDEIDDTMNPNTQNGKKINTLVKNRYKRNSTLSNNTDKENFGFLGFAGENALPNAVMERILHFLMVRNNPKIDKLIYLQEELEEIRTILIRYKYNKENMPSDFGTDFILHGRARELFEPLFAIAVQCDMDLDDLYEYAIEYDNRINKKDASIEKQIIELIEKQTILFSDMVKLLESMNYSLSNQELGYILKNMGLKTKRTRIHGMLDRKIIINKYSKGRMNKTI